MILLAVLNYLFQYLKFYQIMKIKKKQEFVAGVVIKKIKTGLVVKKFIAFQCFKQIFFLIFLFNYNFDMFLINFFN